MKCQKDVGLGMQPRHEAPVNHPHIGHPPPIYKGGEGTQEVI